jgi:serine/threonine-protein kinase RIO1
MPNVLAEAGVSVPAPIAYGSAGILMEFISNGLGPAPGLIDVAIDNVGVLALVLALAWASPLGDVQRMLAVDVVHGDLSARESREVFQAGWRRDEVE